MIVNQSSLRTIALLSNREELDVDINQSNRYCILLNSHLGKEAYYFGTPIYNSDTRKLVKREFAISNGFYQFIGSNSIVEVSAKQLIMKQNNKIFCLKFKNDISWKLQDGVLLSDTFSVIPTYNGVSIKGKIDQLAFYVSTKFFYQNIRVSQNCVCFMESRFKPIVIISALFVQSPNIGCQPMQVKYSEMSKDGGYICFSSNALSYNYGVFDVNFYEPKLIQDTPVSGKFPRENNAFGPIAFVGKTNLFGTQWLYSRLDISKVTELQEKYIREIKLYIPRFTSGSTELEVFGLSNRFCSFGSNWSNKVQKGEKQNCVSAKGDYFCVDLTKAYINRGRLSGMAGVVLTPSRTDELGYQAISTGDSYSVPPILCVKYANY